MKKREERMSIIPSFFGRRSNVSDPERTSIIPSFFGRRSNVSDPFPLGVWDPFEGSAFVSTKIDWKETPEAHVFKADLPGLKKEEVKVEIEDGRVLQISCERCMETEEKGDSWHRVERSRGKFLRRFQLPENAQVDKVRAAIENGVLTVTVPKREVKQPDVEAIIKISG